MVCRQWVTGMASGALDKDSNSFKSQRELSTEEVCVCVSVCLRIRQDSCEVSQSHLLMTLFLRAGFI